MARTLCLALARVKPGRAAGASDGVAPLSKAAPPDESGGVYEGSGI